MLLGFIERHNDQVVKKEHILEVLKISDGTFRNLIHRLQKHGEAELIEKDYRYFHARITGKGRLCLLQEARGVSDFALRYLDYLSKQQGLYELAPLCETLGFTERVHRNIIARMVAANLIESHPEAELAWQMRLTPDGQAFIQAYQAIFERT